MSSQKGCIVPSTHTGRMSMSTVVLKSRDTLRIPLYTAIDGYELSNELNTSDVNNASLPRTCCLSCSAGTAAEFRKRCDPDMMYTQQYPLYLYSVTHGCCMRWRIFLIFRRNLHHVRVCSTNSALDFEIPTENTHVGVVLGTSGSTICFEKFESRSLQVSGAKVLV